VSAGHCAEHEERVLAAAFDAEPPDRAAVAEQIAGCSECLSYAFRLLDDVFALHTVAGSRRATAVPPQVKSVARLDALLDDVMVLMAYREPSPPQGSGGDKAEAGGERSVPIREA